MDFEVRHIDGATVKLISSEHKCAITSATQTRKLCGNDTVTINLQSATYIDFYVGDKITIFGTTYTLNQLPTVKKESERTYSYTLVFEGLQYTLIDRVFLMPANTQGDNLMFDLAGMLRELATNINRGNSGKQYEFVLDNSLEETEYKNLSLTGKNCLQVLQQLCQEWDTEFVFAEEPTRIAIYIGVAGSTFAFPFTYGRGGGVYELNREKGASDICTRLFVYGGTQNLTYYRHNRLCLPSKEKNQSYVEDATAQAVYGIKEQVKNFDDIYPNRIGTITSLSGCDYNEFIDSAMADEEFGFDLNEKWANNADDCAEWLALKGLENTEANRTIYYNDVAGTATKYLMAGATAKIHFNTGALAGYECDLHSYTHSNQKFVLKPLVDENGYDFPSKTNAAFKLAVGDEYVILDINLPTAYKEEAESKLATEAASYFATVCRPQPKYTLTIEPIALKHIVGPSTADTEIFKVGDLINISDPTGGVESATIRIDQFVRNLLDPFEYKLTLTDEITYSQQVRTLIEVDAIKRVVEESKIYDVNRIRRGWKDAEELYNQMFDTEGHYYSEKIAPLSIDTQMLKVGARSQQLVLQNVLFQPNYNANPANLQISAGSLVHYTIEPDIKTWAMSALSASNVPSTAQYVYAKCARNGTSGTWLVTNQAIIFDSDPGYYHFIVGSLSSVDSVSNARNFAATYGYTTINGRYITTGVIKSSDGSSVVIDLNAGIITGKIKFRTSQGTDVDAETYISDTANAAAQTAVNNIEIGGRNLLLGVTNPNATPTIYSHTSYECPNAKTVIIEALTKNAGAQVYYHTMIPNYAELVGKTVTFSIEKVIKSNPDSIARVYLYNNGGTLSVAIYSNQDTTNGWRYTFTFPEVPEGTTEVGLVVRANQSNSGGLMEIGDTVTFIGLKLEKGNKATDWSPAPEDTEAEIANLETELKEQIDGKIETWSQSTDPSTDWTTTQLKDSHVGDFWYYTGITTNTRTNNKTYKYTKSGSTYSWTEHSAGGGDLFDKIDGKTTIYYGATSGSYPDKRVGDFLFDNTTGKEGKSYRWSGTAWVTVQDYQEAIKAGLDSLEIGGKNILRNSADMPFESSGKGGWRASGGTCAHQTIVNAPMTGLTGAMRCTNGSSVGQVGMATDYVDNTNRYHFEVGQAYIMSAYVRGHFSFFKNLPSTISGSATYVYDEYNDVYTLTSATSGDTNVQTFLENAISETNYTYLAGKSVRISVDITSSNTNNKPRLYLHDKTTGNSLSYKDLAQGHNEWTITFPTIAAGHTVGLILRMHQYQTGGSIAVGDTCKWGNLTMKLADNSQYLCLQPIYQSGSVIPTTGMMVIRNLTHQWQKIYMGGVLGGTQAENYSAGYAYLQKASNDGWFEVCGMKLEKGNKVTDWSPAPEDVDAAVAAAQSAADAAQRTADNAETHAQSALTDLTNYASDSKVSPTEKPALKQQLADINAEKDEIVKQATLYSLLTSTEYTDYYQANTGAYQRAVAALNKYTAATPSHIAVESDYANIAAYYPKRQAILDKIAEAAQNYADDAALTAVSNLQIGGRNLLVNSYIAAARRGDSTALLPAQTGWASSFVSATNVAKMLVAGETYTISFDYEITAIQSGKEISNKWAGFGLYSQNDGWVAQLWDTQGLNTVGAKAHFSKTFTLLALPADAAMNIYTQRYSDGTNQTIVFSNLKIEKGNKVTDWTPAPEDTEAELDKITTLNNTLSARINNITDNGIISGGKEKYQLKGEWLEIAGSNGAGTADGSYYTIKQRASEISGSTQSLDTAFSALKAKMDIILTSMSTDTTLDDLSLDADSFNALWKAYYDAETALDNTIQSFYDDRIRKSLEATCSTAEGTQAKVITCAEWKDSFFTAGTKLFVRFDKANSNQHPLISVNGKLGFIRYNNTLSGYRFPEYAETSAPLWLEASVITLEYAGTGHAEWTDGQGQTQRYPANGDYHIWQMPDEGAFKSSQVLQRSIKGHTDIVGGLILTETIALRDANGNETAGMTGITEANDVAFYAGGDLRSAQNGTSAVIIKRTGDAKFGAVKINGSGNGEMIMDSGGVRRLSIKNEPLKLEEQGVTYNADNSHNDNSPTSGTALSGGSVTTAEITHNIFAYGMILSPAHQYVFDVHLTISKVTIAVATAGGAGYISAILEFYNGSEWAYVDSWELYNGQVRTYEKSDLSYLMRYANPTGYAYMGLRLRYKTDASSAGTATVSLSAPKWYYYCDQNKANMQIANDGMCYYLNSANQFAVKTNNDQSLTIKARGEIDIPGVLWAGEVDNAGAVPNSPSYKNASVTLTKDGTSPTDTSLYNFKYTGISGTPIIMATPKITTADGYGWTAMVESLSTSAKTFRVRVKRDNSKVAASFHLVIFGTT